MYSGNEAGLPVREDLVTQNVKYMLEFDLGVNRAVLEQCWEEPVEYES